MFNAMMYNFRRCSTNIGVQGDGVKRQVFNFYYKDIQGDDVKRNEVFN